MIIKVCPKLINIITFGFAEGITLYPFILLKRKEDLDDKVTINHESIHIQQQKETLVIFFYLWYLIEWAIKRSYYKLSFEKEAYQNEANLDYLKTRKHYSWFKLI